MSKPKQAEHKPSKKTENHHDILLGPIVAWSNHDPKHPHTYKLRILIFGLVSSLLVFGACIGIFASQHSLRTTTVGNIEITNNLSLAAIQNAIQNQAQSYKLAVQYPDNSKKSFSLEQMGISVDAETTAEQALQAQKPTNIFARLQWWHSEQIPLSLTINQKSFDKFVDSKLIISIKKPKNSTIKITDGNVQTTPSKDGVAVTITDANQTITSHIENLNYDVLDLEKQSVPPTITKEDANPAKQDAKAILSNKVTFEIDGNYITASKADMGAWIDIEPVKKDHSIDISVNSGKVLDYIDVISAPYVTPVQDKVVLKKDDGSTTVIEEGHNGVDITNKEDLSAQVAEALNNRQDISVTAKIANTNFKTVTTKSYPKSIVIDTALKRLYAYENNKLIRTFLISAGAPGTPTVTGNFAIQWKVRIQDMQGANTDGSRYYQPDVEWVNYFYQDYAIHGNYWRPVSYFGNINSSHGCVGLLNPDAEWIYNWAPVGTPITIFG